MGEYSHPYSLATDVTSYWAARARGACEGPASNDDKCTACGGEGWTGVSQQSGEQCDECDGTGALAEQQRFLLRKYPALVKRLSDALAQERREHADYKKYFFEERARVRALEGALCELIEVAQFIGYVHVTAGVRPRDFARLEAAAEKAAAVVQPTGTAKPKGG